MWKRVQRYFNDFFSLQNIISLVLGTVVVSTASTVLLYVVGFLPDPRKNFWPSIVAFLCILVIAQAFARQRRHRPRFRFALGLLSIGALPGNEQHSSFFVLAFNIIGSDGNKFNGDRRAISQDGLTLNQPDSPAIRYMRCITKPASARIADSLDKLYIQNIKMPATIPPVGIGRSIVFELRCTDSLGDVHQYDFKPSDLPIRGGTRYLPGTQTSSPPAQTTPTAN